MYENIDFTTVIEHLESLEAEVAALRASNVLWGKKWFATGDSFTEGDFNHSAKEDYILREGKYAGKKAVYPYIIGARNNMEVINDGSCGTILPLSKRYLAGEEGFTINDRRPFTFERYKKIPADVDYITLWFGINDSGATNLGTIDDTENTTFYGGWNFILPYLIKNFPNAKIGVIVTNSGKTEYRQATRECCLKWGVPFLDLMGDVSIVPSTGGREDGLGLCSEAKDLWYDRFKVKCVEGQSNGHPCPEWHLFQSSYIENFLRSL